jgi:hypothetical protein
MKTFVISLSILLSSIFFCSCCTTKTITCGNPTIGLVYVGYSSTDLDTIVIRQYKANSNFTILIDTFKVYNCTNAYTSSCAAYYVSNDTVRIGQGDSYTYLGQGYDWTFYVPSSGQTDSLSDITITGSTTNYKDCEANKLPACYSTISSLELNGIVINNLNYPAYSYPLFINKK